MEYSVKMNGDTEKNGALNLAFEKNGEVLENGKQDVTKTQFEVGQEITPQRAQWGNGLEFLMSCIAMSVGLGNIWRFPFTAYKNGGGAFLIPYIIILTLIGRPLYYMEMALGQFSGRGNIKMYSALSPVFKCIGYGQLIGSICVATYYCSLMAMSLFYFGSSFTSDLPWTKCLDSWQDYLNETGKVCNGNDTNSISSSEMYFKREVLHQIDDISDGIGAPQWELTICLLVSWVVTYCVIIKGVSSSGKASYFLALFPYVVMITLLIRAATLEGAADGMYYFIETDWNKLLEADVWYAAITQCFFSLNVGFASIIMYSSYNNFDHNINRDALVVTTLDTFTSLLSGVTIFGILGNLAFELGVTPDKVINSGGTGLAFISYPDAIAKFKAVPWLFALLFFFMLFVLGVGSLVALSGTCVTAIKDAFPNVATWKISGVVVIAGFLIGLLYVTPGGEYVLDLVDYFGGTFIIFVFAIFEVIAVVWVYGLENFCDDLEFMLKMKVSWYWRWTWGVITPLILIVVFIYFVATLEPLTYGREDFKLEYPSGLVAAGWLILAVGLVQSVLWIIYYGTISKRQPGKWVDNMFSFEKWGPKDRKTREEWQKFKQDKMNNRRPNRTFWQRCADSLFGR
ncbi:sodium-dependent nutrient amino acid transporter 1-like [Aethina tumida]|uniref:sodium-dependent nutrient amino acid transporter 1-like n=1 Tax=Aethina tumida TaxID=116153 RepID=UPI00096B071F|nr:sodium-dependent nutrient amino acid transporter 1-like [Aethina tumida]